MSNLENQLGSGTESKSNKVDFNFESIETISKYNADELIDYIRFKIIFSSMDAEAGNYNVFSIGLSHLEDIRKKLDIEGNTINSFITKVYLKLFISLYSVTKPALATQEDYLDNDFRYLEENKDKFTAYSRNILKNTFSLIYNFMGNETKGTQISRSIPIPESSESGSLDTKVAAGMNSLLYFLTFRTFDLLKYFTISVLDKSIGVTRISFRNDNISIIDEFEKIINNILSGAIKINSEIDKYILSTHTNLRSSLSVRLSTLLSCDIWMNNKSAEMSSLLESLFSTVVNYRKFGSSCDVISECKDCSLSNVMDIRIVISLLLLYAYKTYYHIRQSVNGTVDHSDTEFFENYLPSTLKSIEEYINGDKSILNPSIMEHTYIKYLYDFLINNIDTDKANFNNIRKNNVDFLGNILYLSKNPDKELAVSFISQFIFKSSSLQAGHIEYYFISELFDRYYKHISFSARSRIIKRILYLNEILYSPGHDPRVSNISVWIVNCLYEHKDELIDYPTLYQQILYLKENIQLFAQATVLHDLGKLDREWTNLSKKGKLTNEEFDNLKGHVEHGLLLADHYFGEDDPEFLKMLKLAINHHERPDGRGYPQGLSGDDIPLASLVVCIADSTDAMSIRRIYNESEPSLEYVFNELTKNIGTQFHEQIMKVIIKYGYFDKLKAMFSSKSKFLLQQK